MKRWIGFISFLLLGSSMHAQQITYGGMQQVFYAQGDLGNNDYGFSIINGIRHKQYYAGIGFNLSLIKYNEFLFSNTRMWSVPLYIHTRYYIGKKQWAYAIVEGGIIPSFLSGYVKGNTWNNVQDESFKFYTGSYGSLGAGVRAKLGKEVYYNFNMLWNYSHTRFDHRFRSWPSNQMTTTKYEIQSSFIILRIGFEI